MIKFISAISRFLTLVYAPPCWVRGSHYDLSPILGARAKCRLVLVRYSARVIMLLMVAILFLAPTAPMTYAQGLTCPVGMSQLDCDAITMGWTSWAPDNGNACQGNGNGDITSVSGSDNPSKVWNYFKSQGVDDLHTAAIMGNMQQESSFNPTLIQKGGNSKNPADAGRLGWGLSQWSPGVMILDVAKKYSILSPIYELVTQLNITWREMNDVAPTGYKNFIADFKKETDLEKATMFYANKYEGAGIIGRRYQFAQQALQRYGGTEGVAGAAPVCGGASSVSSVECATAQGRAKILCEAKKYDPVSYRLSGDAGHQGGAEWHKTCPTIGPSCYLDCSGLVNIAVYDAFGVDLRENTTSERSSKYWQRITLAQLQPGDIFQPNSGHVEIVDHVEGNRIYSFGAHTAKRAQPGQVGPSVFTAGSGYLYLRYTGPGV